VNRLAAADVACWLLKTSQGPDELVGGWAPGAPRTMTRCLGRSYRLDLMAPGQPCVLWVSGRHRPGVHAVGTLAGPIAVGDGGPVVPVALTLLGDPVLRADLLLDPAVRDAEVLRMPAGSNPSWLSARQYAAVLARI
jgi:hypothetical protein